MKKLFALALIGMAAACSSPPPPPQETFPYGMTEREWNALSVRDQARIRRDYFFFKSGNTSFVNPDINVEGREAETNHFTGKKNP